MTNEFPNSPVELKPKPLMPENQLLVPDSPEFEERVGFLEVGDGYKIQYEVLGPLDAEDSILCIPGGPGSQYDKTHDVHPEDARRIFVAPRGTDPGVSPDQYGIENNTLDAKIEDLVKLLDELGIEKAVLSGGSFGSTIALAFASKYPDRVKGLLLWGVHTGLEEYFDEYISERAQNFAPDHYKLLTQDYVKQFGEQPSTYKDIVNFHRNRLYDKDDNGMPTVEAKRSAAVYALWQLKLAQPPEENMDEATAFTYSMINNQDILKMHPEQIFDTFVNFGVKTVDELLKETAQPLETFANNSFMTDELDFRKHVERLREIPITIVAGTEDHNTPINVAEDVVSIIGGDNIKFVPVHGGHIRNDTVVDLNLRRESKELLARAA